MKCHQLARGKAERSCDEGDAHTRMCAAKLHNLRQCILTSARQHKICETGMRRRRRAHGRSCARTHTNSYRPAEQLYLLLCTKVEIGAIAKRQFAHFGLSLRPIDDDLHTKRVRANPFALLGGSARAPSFCCRHRECSTVRDIMLV